MVEVEVKRKGNEHHDVTVVGDTVGDSFKDNSCVALNPVIKFTTLFGLLAVALAVEMEKKQGAGLTAACACLFCAIAAYFLWRSFYGMRIRKSLAD